MRTRLMVLVMTSLLFFFSALLASANGSVARQAKVAVENSVKLFLASESKEVRDDFHSIHAELDEQGRFIVNIGLKTLKMRIQYTCKPKGKAKHVVWECQR